MFYPFCFFRYFYENTAPLWSEFSSGIWKDAERLFLRRLNSARGKHLVVAGTINSTHLSSSQTNAQKPFFLQWPDSIPVPLSIWWMIYDVRAKTGIVLIGMNTPLPRGDRTMHFCEKIKCPSMLGRRISKRSLVYCCSKESFEEAYGPLDPVVFKQF